MDNAINERAQQSALASDTIAARQASTLWGLFRERVRRSPDAIAYRDYNRTEGGWRDHTWRMISERVDRFRAALAQENITAGDRVAILLPNGIDWVCLDLAAHAIGLGCRRTLPARHRRKQRLHPRPFRRPSGSSRYRGALEVTLAIPFRIPIARARVDPRRRGQPCSLGHRTNRTRTRRCPRKRS